MKQYLVSISENARRDLREAYHWIAQYDLEAAAHWLVRFETALQSLDTSPGRCSLAPESTVAKMEIRQYLFGKRRNVYRALFVIEADDVRILHIRHSSRRFAEPDELFGS